MTAELSDREHQPPAQQPPAQQSPAQLVREPVSWKARLRVVAGAPYTEVDGTAVSVVPATTDVVVLTAASAQLLSRLDGRPLSELLGDQLDAWTDDERRSVLELLRRFKAIGLLEDAPPTTHRPAEGTTAESAPPEHTPREPTPIADGHPEKSDPECPAPNVARVNEAASKETDPAKSSVEAPLSGGLPPRRPTSPDPEPCSTASRRTGTNPTGPADAGSDPSVEPHTEGTEGRSASPSGALSDSRTARAAGSTPRNLTPGWDQTHGPATRVTVAGHVDTHDAVRRTGATRPVGPISQTGTTRQAGTTAEDTPAEAAGDRDRTVLVLRPGEGRVALGPDSEHPVIDRIVTSPPPEQAPPHHAVPEPHHAAPAPDDAATGTGSPASSSPAPPARPAATGADTGDAHTSSRGMSGPATTNSGAGTLGGTGDPLTTFAALVAALDPPEQISHPGVADLLAALAEAARTRAPLTHRDTASDPRQTPTDIS